MKVLTATWTKEGSINVTVEDQPEGTSITVPDDMANKDRVALEEWMAEGNIITPYVEPEAKPAGPTLEERLAVLEAQIAAR